jgi:hypothetical protein
VSDLQKVFTRIFQTNGFWGSESISGPGSDLASTEALRSALPALFRSFGIRRIVDAPCGDMNWMRHVEYEFEFFVGADIVRDLIARLRAEFQSDRIHFQTANICEDILPQADAVFCRDCFVHLSFANVRDATRLLKLSGTRFIITTTFPDIANSDVDPGGWRQINLESEPFRWPSPMKLIRENAPEREDRWTRGKSLGMWPIVALPD